ncbi:Metallo-dependent phosphatase-like protein [Aspergillus cavernicola]|uniref:Metallo-dependent phosphatase-like protein n=1 Tax=Aspergillus cavernicola TaxID=176166 RepID=A0ABR4J3P8_9EURO
MESPTSSPNIRTRFLILSDTHGREIHPEYSKHHADVVMHCGGLTTESKIEEFKTAIRDLRSLDAPLKLVIAGNHDFTMDIPIFQGKVIEANLDLQLVKKEYGDYGEVRELFDQARESGIILLDEGIHSFTLQNGALLKVYASPYTPSLGNWGFQYHPKTGHDFRFGQDIDIVITHGPPKGIMDSSCSGGRAGCPHLFKAIARARPRMHCFGHIHEGWGTKLVQWRERVSEDPTHFMDIDHGKSTVIGRLSDMDPGTRVLETSHCTEDQNPLKAGPQTLFVNAAIEGTDDFPAHPLWKIDLELSRAT